MAFRAAGVNYVPGSMGAAGMVIYSTEDDTRAEVRAGAYFTKATVDASTDATKGADQRAQAALEDGVRISRQSDVAGAGIPIIIKASDGLAMGVLEYVSAATGLRVNTGAAWQLNS